MTATQQAARHHHRGFTLIELLVVIAIVLILASVGFGVSAKVTETARKATAKKHCIDLITGVDRYHDAYQRLPLVDGSADLEVETDNTFMDILLGFDQGENEQGIPLFESQDAGGEKRARATGGLFYTGRSAELFDPWRRSGSPRNRHYFVLLDGNLDGELTSPAEGKILRGKRALAWSIGKDGKLGSGKDKETRDNIYSWK